LNEYIVETKKPIQFFIALFCPSLPWRDADVLLPSILHQIGKRLQPGSLSQKKIDLVEQPSSGGFVL
jgi:hypothetical protein